MSFIDKLTAQLPFHQKPETAEYYFALNIGLSEVTSVVWELFGNKIDILGHSTLKYKGSDDLVVKAYEALDKSLGALEIEPKKVLFGVPDSWGQEDDLKEPYLKLLKRLLKESDLEPLAYVVTTTALSYFIQKQDGIPLTAVFLGVGDFIEATLVRGGKIIENRVTERSDHLFDDIEKVLKMFTDNEVLPSKILLYATKSSEDLSTVKDELMSYPWMQKLSFLHLPKVDVLENSVLTKAMIFAAAAEVNPQIDLKHSFLTAIPTKHPVQSFESNLPRHIAKDETSLGGFVEGDIKEVGFKKDIEIVDEEGPADDNLISPDLDEVEKMPTRHESVRSNLDWNGIEEQITSVKSPVVKTVHRLQKILHQLGLGRGAWLPKLIPAAGIILALGAAYIVFVKAVITIYVEPRVLENNAEVVADPNVAVIDESKKIIPGSVVETTVTGSLKDEATGQKQIGDPAKGKVVIYNLTNNKVSISQGSTLISSAGLKFTLDSGAQIASQSASTGADYVEVKKPGKSDPVGVTAGTIGPDGNLAADNELTLTGFTKSQVVARVEEALSGGTSRDVKVVTSDDQKRLKAKLLDELKSKGEVALKEKLPAEKKIISEALTITDGKYTFSKQVGDQASEFSLNATVHFKGTAYSETDLRTIVAKLVETNVPDNYSLKLSDTETQAEVAKVEKDGKLIFQARFKAKLLPKFNLEELKKEIRGKSIDSVVDQLKSLESVVGSEIKMTPNLPAPLARLPLWERNISIEVTPK